MHKMKEIGEEDSNYPMNRTIKWKSQKRSFQYYIIEEGVYPPKSYLAYTKVFRGFMTTSYCHKENIKYYWYYY